MTKLVQNYQEMKSNFNDLMMNLKQTNGDQEKIVTELKNLKNNYENKESRLKVEASDKEQKRQLREQAKE